MKPLIWIVDEEWPDYELEHRLIREKYPDCDIRHSPHNYLDDLEAFGLGADGIITQIYAEFPAEVISRLNNCRAISVYGAGFDRVAVPAATAKGIKVTNVPGYSNEDVSDYVMAGIYHFYKHLADLSARVRELPWGAQALPAPPQRLSHSVLHILGLGRIGRMVAAKARANSLTVTAYDPFVPEEAMRELGVRKVDWDEGLSGADYVSVHLILNDQTRGLVKYEDFQKMKPTAGLINAARGQVIDESGLVRALNEGLIAGAVLDTLAVEPPTYREAIFDCPNVWVTPHTSFISVQSFEELKRRAAVNLLIGLDGGDSPDLVNRL